MSIQLEDGETIIKEGGASHARGIETVGGHLWLTSRRMHFESHAMNIQRHEESFPLQDIISIWPHKDEPAWMHIGMKDGREEKFVIFEREGWLKSISEAIGIQASPPRTTGGQGNLPLVAQPVSTPASPSQPGSSIAAQAPSQPIVASMHRPLKDRSVAMILEILPGMFGLLGFGWLYADNTSTGILWLVGMLIWDVVAVGIGLLTGGFGCICTWPISIVLLAISASSLNGYTKRRIDLFG